MKGVEAYTMITLTSQGYCAICWRLVLVRLTFILSCYSKEHIYVEKALHSSIG